MLFLLCIFMASNSIYAMDEGKKEESCYKQRVVTCPGSDLYSCVKLFSLQGGRRCAAQCRDGISLWDFQDNQSTYRPLVRITHTPPITTCALSADERFCATICIKVVDGFMALWDIETAKLLLKAARPFDYENMTKAVAITDNFVVFSDCDRLDVIDRRSGEYEKAIHIEHSVVESLAVLRHCRNVLLALTASGIKEVDVETGNILSLQEAARCADGSIYISDDGKKVVTKRNRLDWSSVDIYKNKALSHTYQPKYDADKIEKGVIDDAALSGDGSTVIVTETERSDSRGLKKQRVPGYLYIIDTEPPHTRRILEFHKEDNVYFPVVTNYDASRIIATKNDGQIIVIDRECK